VLLLSLLPLSISIAAAYVAWLVVPWVEAFHMIITVLVWVAAFAVGTQLFWKGVELLAAKQ